GRARPLRVPGTHGEAGPLRYSRPWTVPASDGAPARCRRPGAARSRTEKPNTAVLGAPTAPAGPTVIAAVSSPSVCRRRWGTAQGRTPDMSVPGHQNCPDAAVISAYPAVGTAFCLRPRPTVLTVRGDTSDPTSFPVSI